MRKIFHSLVLLALCSALAAQQALNNEAIIKLVKGGLSDDFIVSTINNQPGNFDASPDAIVALKNAGASDRVMTALVQKVVATSPAVAPPTPPAPVPDPAPASASAPVPAPVLAPATAPAAIPTVQPVPAVAAPTSQSTPLAAAATATPPAPSAVPFHSTDGKLRVYITDHPISESTFAVRGAAAAGHRESGDDPRVVEIEADILKVCPAYIVASINQDRADYILIFRRRGGSRSSMFAFGGLTGLALSGTMKVDGASLFQTDGDMVYATKQNTVEKAIRETCAHIPAPGSAAARTGP
jgi:hypothetical protein